MRGRGLVARGDDGRSVVARGLGFGEVEEGSPGGPEGAEVHGVGSGEGLPCPDELLGVPLPGFAARHHFFPVHSRVA